MFEAQGLHVRKNILGFLIYLLPYGMILQPAAVIGYVYEILGLRKEWGTK
jgi:biofilm PGA synthesis N-glycosyltransferase PgaC